MFFKFFLKYSLRPIFFVCKFFFEKKRCRTTTPHQFFVFFIMTMKTSSIILCFFLMIEPLTLNCAYFRKKRFFVMFFGRWRGQDIFVRSGKFLFWENIFWEGFLLFFVYQAKQSVTKKGKKWIFLASALKIIVHDNCHKILLLEYVEKIIYTHCHIVDRIARVKGGIKKTYYPPSQKVIGNREVDSMYVCMQQRIHVIVLVVVLQSNFLPSVDSTTGIILL